MRYKEKARGKSPDYTVLSNFIVLEGLDGAGTTTQLKLIDEELSRLGVLHYCTSEPSDGFIGKIIRSILEKKIQALPKTTALLFAADRNEHLNNPEYGIIARLRREELVICDRYLFSSLAYQSERCGFDFVLSLNRTFPLPQHLIFLDTPIDLSQKRLTHREEEDIFERTDLQPRILSDYKMAFSLYNDSDMTFHRLDGSRQPELVFQDFWNIIQTLPMVKV